jgi:hypothetical protein
MILQIPVQKDIAFWEQRTPLDDTDFRLSFAWNDRAQAWFLSIADLDGEPIISGIKLISNQPLLKKYRWDDRVPLGEIFVVDYFEKIDCPNFTDLNENVFLLYFDVDTVTGGIDA